MPAIYNRPRKSICPYFQRVAERMAMRKLSFFFMILAMFYVIQIQRDLSDTHCDSLT